MDDLKLARIRYLLERGRVFNSSGKPEKALPFFVEASELAIAEKQNRYAIDAVHMIAIAEPDPQKQVEWNLKGIAMVEADPSQRGWLWSLYNNIAESYALLKEYQTSLDYTYKLLDFQRERGEADMYTLKDEARFLRLLGKPGQALPLIEKLAEKHPDDPWIREELAESRRAGGQT
jgi:tetratricopeptide (TPR) repeat protein